MPWDGQTMGELEVRDMLPRTPGARSTGVGLTTGPELEYSAGGPWCVTACHWTAADTIARFDVRTFTVNPSPETVNIAVQIQVGPARTWVNVRTTHGEVDDVGKMP